MGIPTKALTLIGIALLTAGCAPNVLQVTTSPADAAAAEAALEPGSATITGSALIRQRGGGVVSCAGNDVFLVPGVGSLSSGLTSIFGGDEGYVRRGGSTTLGGGNVVQAPQPNRRTQCDTQGYFEFGDVQPGRWHIMTEVTWAVGENYQGGALLATTNVGTDDEVEVVLTAN